jgi:hypothetical protein
MNTLAARILIHARALIGVLGIVTALGAKVLASPGDQVVVDSPLRLKSEGKDILVSWQMPPESGTNLQLLSASSLEGTWTMIPAAPEPLRLPIEVANRLFFRTELMLEAGAPSPAEIASAVRSFAFARLPRLNPSSRFDTRVLPVRDLWETMQIQILEVIGLSTDDQQFNRFGCVLHRGEAKALGLFSGSHWTLSGLVRGESLYFTYRWGAGTLRSHVAKLQVVNGELMFLDSGGLFGELILRDVFVSGKADGGIAILRGRYGGFNRWSDPVEIGHIDESDPAAPKLMDFGGNVIATLVPTVY